MFVSILQLMGFPVGKPVHSRAEEDSRSLPSKARAEGLSLEASGPVVNRKHTLASDAHVKTDSARRQEMKTKAKAHIKVKVVPKAAKVAVKAKTAVKAAAKPKVKAAVKAKPVIKAAAKPAVKKSSAAKAPAKVALPVKTAKPVAKVKVKVKVAKVVPVKAIRPTAKVKAKDSVKTTIAKVGKPHVVTPKKAKIAPAVIPVKIAVAAPATLAAATVPARAGRPSSRLAQLTVPSMAQSVASTAAKASFTQAASTVLIVPPLASTIKKDPKLANNWKSKPVEQLTDAELIAMPDDVYMNEAQMAFFRRKLSQLKKDILSSAGETTEHLREDTVVVPDPADRATIEEEHALELRTRDRERKLLKKIEQSIQRIDSGDYGYCDETGEPIGVARLLARPTANLSLEAQQRRELKQKMFGD
jgi:DnaK suppressor protein